LNFFPVHVYEKPPKDNLQAGSHRPAPYGTNAIIGTNEVNMKFCRAILAAAALLLPAAAPAATNPAGRWEGTLKTPNGDLTLIFNLHQEGGQWAGEMDVPEQHISELPLKDIKVDGAAVGFAFNAPGEPRFDGNLSKDGKTLSGNFSQGGAVFPLELAWKSEPRAVAAAPANSGEVQVLEGVWEGTLDAGGQQLRLRFHFTRNADGSITGALDSLDQGAEGIPINSIAREGDSVKMEVKSIGGWYEATLDQEGATLTGTWRQAGNDLPLTLKRSKVEKKG
jgi:uncharacterized protein